MISIANNRPVLQIGRYQVAGYDTDWIETALRLAAERSERGDCPFLAELREGIEHYLEHRCSLSLLKLEELYARMRQMLEEVGCPALAENLPVVAPPLKISLVPTAEAAGSGYELLFFKLLRDDLEDLQAHGVSEIEIEDLRQCVLILRGRQKFTAPCSRLARDIEAFLLQFERSRAVNADF
ncbi:MAG: hypothetical protein ACQKBY_04365 [Verrucomicrobiales bacterium]